jgi:uncharacterized membrane protein YuzA (DUF378 family)
MERAAAEGEAARDEFVASQDAAAVSTGGPLALAKALLGRGTRDSFFSIRLKVFALMVVVGALFVALSGAFVFRLYGAQVDSIIKLRASGLRELVTHSVEKARSADDLQFIADAVGNTSRVETIAILDAKGRIVAASRRDWRGKTAATLADPVAAINLSLHPHKLERMPSASEQTADFIAPIHIDLDGQDGTLFFRVNIVEALSGLQETAWGVVVWLATGATVAVLTLALLMQRIFIAPSESLRS